MDGGVAGIVEKTLEHFVGGEMVELESGGFRVGGVGAEVVAGGAERIEPGGVFGSELLFEFLAKALSKRRTFAVGGDGDLQVAALDDGTIVEVAVVNVVDGVAEDLTLVGFTEDGGVDVVERGGGDDQECSSEVSRLELFGEPGDFAIAGAFSEFGIEYWRDHRDLGAGFEQAGDFGGSDGAAADDEDGAVVEL